jgi:hypothetical protein
VILAAGLAAADDQHRPVREPAGIAVAGGVDLGQPVWEGADERGKPRPVLVAGGHDHRTGQELAGVGAQGVPVAGGSQPAHPDALADRAGGGEPPQPRHDLRAEVVGVARLVSAGDPQQVVHPAGGVEPERAPPLRPPALAGPAALQDHVLDPAGGQGGAGREPGRARAHHRAVDCHRPRAAASAARNASGRSIVKWPASSTTCSGQP